MQEIPASPQEGLTAAIPTTGDRSSLRASVEAVLRSAGQAGGITEVLVVVNGRPDAPALRGLRSPLLRVIHLAQRNKSLARNAAIDAARHDTILFTDDDGVVPPQWCAQLREGLARPGPAVVAAPACTVATGPVTGFLNYQRVFVPPPDADGGAGYAITLNCGIRRDRLPATVRFDPAFLVTEDIDFGHSVRSSGLTIGWLPDAVPVRHDLPESFETIGGRYPAYGAGLALLHRKRGQVTALMPAFHSAYLARADGDLGYRRFSELTQEPARAAFTILETVAVSLFLVGYLDELGDDPGRKLIETDQAALTAALGQIAAPALARARQLAPGDWATPAFDYSRFGSIDVDLATPELRQVKAALAQHARPVRSLAPAAQLAPMTWEQPAWAAWRRMGKATGQPTPDSVDRLFRAAGVGFGEGSHQVEIKLWREHRASREPAAHPA
jgi:glycosyltransferase involved in cell wall biosynthesis